jgi:YVTN family beta-propeller protein
MNLNEGLPKMKMNRKLSSVVVGAAVLAAAAAYAVLGAGAASETKYADLVNYVVVQSAAAPEITLVNMYDETVAGTIALPAQPHQVVISNDLNRIVFSSRETRAVYTYNLATKAVDATIELPFVPENIVLSPDGLILAAADPAAGMVGILNLARKSLLPVIEGLNHPVNLSFDNDSSYVFVSDSVASEIKVFDALSGARLDPIKLSIGDADAGQNAVSAVTRSTSGLYGLSADSESGRMSIINFRDWREIQTIELGRNPTRPYGTSDGRFMLVANNDDRTVSILSTDYFDIEATLPGVSDVTSIVTGYLERVAYVVSASEKKAVIIDLIDMKAMGEVAFDGTPGPAVVDADGLKMFVALTDTNELAVVDMKTGRVSKKIPNVGHSPLGVTMSLTNNVCH